MTPRASQPKALRDQPRAGNGKPAGPDAVRTEEVDTTLDSDGGLVTEGEAANGEVETVVPAPVSLGAETSPSTLEPPASARTPPDRVPPPVATPDAPHDLSRSECFLNRELTWLNYTFRILHEAEDERTPLLERMKFIAIVSSNLDEFFMKRIGGLKQQVGAGIHDLSVDGRTPEEQIAQCYDLVREVERRKHVALLKTVSALESAGILLTTYERLPSEDQKRLRQYYVENIYPLVTPQGSDPAHPFPFISNLSLNLLVSLRSRKDSAQSLARVKVPVGAGIPRFLRVRDTDVFVTLESVMAHNLDVLFPGIKVNSCEVFRVTRNANTEVEEENADDLLAVIETGLRERKFAPVVRLEVARSMQPYNRGRLAAELGLDERADVFEVEGLLGMRDLMQLALLERAALRDPPHHPIDHPQLGTDRSIFHVIRDLGSILLHHPYQAFSTSVVRFLREASQDPKVRAIKMTLYRTSAESRAIDYLIEAARNGKQVAVVVELKARFDEEANIRWANRLEATGIHVTYGVVGLKTHCKAILVVRQDYNGLARYAHVGTGNYHAGTARLYSDLAIFTDDPAIGKDLTELFNYLTTGYRPKRNYTKVLPAPKVLKRALLEKIDREVTAHSADSPGLIQLKLNALEDADVTRALYRASQAGVTIDLIVRDTCRLRPGIAGLSETIRVISVVGRFLEHSRIYYFRNGGAEEYYIGSADCMQRNLESRVEVLAPVEAPELRQDLRVVLDTQLADQRSAWEMQPDGSYVQRMPVKRKEERSSQRALIEWAEKRHREASRLRRRKPRGISRRNVR